MTQNIALSKLLEITLIHRQHRYHWLTLLVFAILAASFSVQSANANEIRPALVYPLVGTRVSSKFGMRMHPVVHRRRHHHGLDLAAPEDAPVRSIQGGTIIWADPHGGYGNLIVVQHANGLTSHYGHLNTIHARIGERIKAGQIIGTVGSTGRVTGPHLHFEVRKNGEPLDPLDLFPNIARKGQG